VSPLLTQSLVHVPMRQAADASGLLTTTIQLGQVVGIAVFGTVFLSLRGPAAVGRVHASAAALSTTGYWLAGLAGVALAAAVLLARTVRRAARAA
jgi:hypothetical protein